MGYEYRNEPKPNAVRTMHAHRGTAVLRLKRNGCELEGEYYSGRDRLNYGSLLFKVVDESFTAEALWETDLTGRHLHPRYRFLPLDTRYFKDLEVQILALFDNLDEALDGWLVKSENYQALKTMLPKFQERVQTIYIDPPFNKEQDADYFYSV